MPRLVDVVPHRVASAVHAVLPNVAWSALRDVATGEHPAQRSVRQARAGRLDRRTRGRYDVPTTGVDLRGAVLVARVVERFSSTEVLAANAAFVLDALTAAGLTAVVVDAPTARRRVVAIARPDVEAALAALTAAAQRRPVYAAWVTGRTPGRSRPVADVRMGPDQRVLRVYEPYASPDGFGLAGEAFGCDLELWDVVEADLPATVLGEPVPAGALVAPRSNRWADVADLTRGEPAVADVDGAPRRRLPAVGAVHQLDVTFPVDAVYTWVDGGDPAWLARKVAAQGDTAVHAFAANASRFTSYDELRYSLRSLAMYADWIRTVHLVTDEQVPPWLDVDHPKVRVVSHRELFGSRGRLPTFNSHAIETQLHHLPGLAEHYLYLNDDVFFGRPVSPDVFFQANGVSKYFPSNAKLGLGPSDVEDMPGTSAGKNNRDLLHKAFGVTVTNKFKHVPITQRRDVMLDLEQRFPQVFAETASHQFRRESDYSVAPSLHHAFGYQTGRAVEGRIRYFYADVSDPLTVPKLAMLLRRRDYDVFCLNDHDSSRLDPAEQARIVGDFLRGYFPLPGPFER